MFSYVYFFTNLNISDFEIVSLDSLLSFGLLFSSFVVYAFYVCFFYKLILWKMEINYFYTIKSNFICKFFNFF